jgi:hypothetical protein
MMFDENHVSRAAAQGFKADCTRTRIGVKKGRAFDTGAKNVE